MKLMFVITGLGLGGAERQVVDLADSFAAQGVTVMIVYLTGPADVLPSRSDVRVVGLGITKSLFGFLKASFMLRRLVQEFAPDVVHSHMVHANLLARIVRMTTRVPRLISTAHSTNEGGKLRMLAYRITDGLADVSTNVSEEAVQIFEAKGATARGRMVAVPNGINIHKFSRSQSARDILRAAEQIGSHEKVILAVGRLVEAKDYSNLLHALAIVTPTYPHVKLWIAGKGELLGQLTALARDLGVERNVRFLGARSDVPALLNAADIFVLSSAWEGLPLAIAESMSSEKVVVATDCGGVREVLGDAGYLVPARDSGRLAHALSDALALDTASAAALGASARARIVAKYSLEAAVEMWHQVYRRRAAN